MENPKPSPAVIPTRDELLQIHVACSDFESHWSTSQRLTIEQLLECHTSKNRSAWVESLIRSELELRANDPIAPTMDEFTQRFPLDSESVHRAFEPYDVAIADTSKHPTSETSHPNVPRGPVEPMLAQLGPYEILGEIARGGMGILYRARHQELDRIVALKVMKSGKLASEWELARFQTEIQTIASLDHPNIVPIYEAGNAAGYHYFSMPLVEGEC